MSSIERELQHSIATLGRIQIMNENWRGKTDPAERRRIQNRLNQRAFRERQRTASSNASSTDSDPDSAPSSPQPRLARSTPAASRNATTPALDELSQTINRNVMQAVASNCQQLSIPVAALRSSAPILTPQQGGNGVAQALTPTKLQHMVPHDPFLDAIPHPRFRLNCMKAIANKTLDPARLSASLRRSGQLLDEQRGTRDGLIVWGEPENCANWELSEAFVVICGRAQLLDGCEDWMQATNWWRTQRGEAPLFPGSY